MKVVMVAFTNIEYTVELSEALSNSLELILMIPEKQADRFRNVIKKNLKLSPFKQSRLRNPRNIFHVMNIMKEINIFKPDIIHVQRGNPWFNLFIPKMKKCGFVTTIHDVELHSGDKESSRIPEFTNKISIQYADQIIVHGQELKAQLIKKIGRPADEVNVLHRGINSIYTRYIENSMPIDPYSILFFGRIWEYKGLRYLIEAEPIISKKIPKLKIIIAGRGEDVSKYNKYMINKDKFIIHNHHISNKMVAELFQRSSIVVLPYTDASQSGVVPLAYAFRKPVIVTNVGSLPEVVDDGNTGYIVPPRNPQVLAEAIIDLLTNDRKRIEMGENAYRKACGDLSWERIAEKTIDVYEKAISKGPRRKACI